MLAAQVLVFGRIDAVRARVRLKVPASHVDDVTDDVLLTAITSSFDGSTEGEFGAWLRVITNRRIADFHRRREARQLAIDKERTDVESDHQEESGMRRWS